MSVYWYKIGDLISLGDLENVNKKLKEQKLEKLQFCHDLLTDQYWLERTEFGKTGVMVVHDYSKKDECFGRMTTYGLSTNKAEIVLDALVTIGGLTIASEFDSRSPYYQAQASAVDHNKLKHSTQKERIKAGITKH